MLTKRLTVERLPDLRTYYFQTRLLEKTRPLGAGNRMGSLPTPLTPKNCNWR